MTGLRILVMGANNFAGSRVIDALRTSGWAPIGVDTGADVLPETVRDLHGIVNAAVGKPDTIRAQAHAAAEAARAAGPKTRLVHLSSMTVYGPGEGLVDESVAPPGDLSGYAAAQIEAEHTVQTHPNTVRLRLGCEYGPGCPQWSMRIGQLLLARRLGDLGAAGDGTCNLLFIDDLVAAVSASLVRPSLGGGIFNLSMRSPPTWNEYFIRFGIALRAVPIRRISERRLQIESRFLAPPLRVLEILSRGLRRASGTPALTSSLVKLCRQQITLDIAKAETTLGMQWTALDEGIRRAATAVLAIAPL